MLRSRTLRISLVFMMAGLIAAGCSTRAGWQYTPGPEPQASTRVPLVVAVPQFSDQRGTANSRYFFLCIIPLVPYCSGTYEQPENANGFLTAGSYNFRPVTDLAEATASEVRQAGIFKDVYATNRTSDPGSQLEIRGTIDNTTWDGTMYSYMLGPYGNLLWLFGLPLGSAENTLGLKLELVETASGRPLWSARIDQNYASTEGIYYHYATDFGYPQMFRTGIQSAIASLEVYVAQQPPGFWDGLATSAPAPSMR